MVQQPSNPDLIHATDIAERAAEAARQWVTKTGRRTRRLPPWDELMFFALPRETNVPLPGGQVTQICQSNPNRVALIFGSPPGGSLNLSTRQDVTTTTGFQLSASTLPVQLYFRDFAALVTGAWFAIPQGPGTSVTVIELLLNKWPSNGELLPDT